MSNRKPYYDPEDLAAFGAIAEDAPELGEKFFAWYGDAFEGGALSKREKSLIALAVSHALQCPYCIDAYTASSAKNGADAEQMMEAVHVAAAIQAGSTLVHATQMRKRLNDLEM